MKSFKKKLDASKIFLNLNDIIKIDILLKKFKKKLNFLLIIVPVIGPRIVLEGRNKKIKKFVTGMVFFENSYNKIKIYFSKVIFKYISRLIRRFTFI